MKFLIIFAFAWATVNGLPANEMKSRNIVVPAGRPEGRMSNAFIAHEEQIPYQVAINRHYTYGDWKFCSGILISNTEVITAAHCTQNVLKVDVFLGSVKHAAYEVMHEVLARDIVIHPGWNNVSLENDISIIHIPYTNYSANIQAAKLPLNASSDFSGETAVASGWGYLSASVAGMSKDLRFANFTVIPNSVCGKTFLVFPSNICVATYNKISPCVGDSGGPLVLEDSKMLIGITSFIWYRGCEKNKPAAFTRVTSFLDWIQQNSNISN